MKADVNTNLHTKFLLQIWKQRENSAMLLAGNKQHYKEKTQNQNTWQNRLNTQKRTARKNIDQGGLQQAPNLQDSMQNSEHSKCWNSKKEFLFIEQPSSPLTQNI